MKTQALVLAMLLLTLSSCDRLMNKTKETINKGGETVGKTATEFFEGVSEGIDKTLQCDVVLSQKLIDNGLTTGKFAVENDSAGGANNVLVLYIIFDKDFSGSVMAKAYDKMGLEIGRSAIDVSGKTGDAGYFDFKFDKRTYIEVKSKIIIE